MGQQSELRGGADVLALQMDALYQSAPASVLSIVGAFMALAVYWSPATAPGLLVFFGCVSTVALVHLASAALRSRGRPRHWTPAHWARLVAGIYVGSGLSWGMGGAWMLGHGTVEQALVICCLCMGAVTVTFPAVVYPRAFNLFQVPIFLALACALPFSTLHYGAILSAAAAMLCGVMALIGKGIGSQLVLALRLSEENARLAKGLAERGAALEAANLELETLSLTDPLTGAANRRHLMRFLRAASGQCAVLVVDVDHFKSYNDSFGHADGDLCLVLVAEALQRSARPGIDLVARQGGEEFAVVLPDQTREQATALAEQIRSDVEALFETRPRQVRRPVTVSVGLSWRAATERKTIADLMEEADAAVYEAKEAGRNRVCPFLARSRKAVA